MWNSSKLQSIHEPANKPAVIAKTIPSGAHSLKQQKLKSEYRTLDGIEKRYSAAFWDLPRPPSSFFISSNLHYFSFPLLLILPGPIHLLQYHFLLSTSLLLLFYFFHESKVYKTLLLLWLIPSRFANDDWRERPVVLILYICIYLQILLQFSLNISNFSWIFPKFWISRLW